ncbi:MAG: hypothetical protein AAGI38_19230 [Bacteroidota bacterium]
MPAKAKYLSSKWQRASKVTAAILGSYLATMFIHMAAVQLADKSAAALMTTAYSTFLMWVAFMTLAFLVKKGWHIWAIYGGITLVCSLILFL